MEFNDPKKMDRLLDEFSQSLKNNDEKLFKSTCEELGPALFCWEPKITNNIFSKFYSPLKNLEEITINIEPLFVLFQLNFETFDESQKNQLFELMKSLYVKLPNADNCLYCLIFMVDFFIDKNILDTLTTFSNLEKSFLREMVPYGLYYLIQESKDSSQRIIAENTILKMCEDVDEKVKKEAQANFSQLVNIRN